MKNYISRKLVAFLYVVIWCLTMSQGVLANDSLLGESGHTVSPIQTKKVRMVSEKISVKMKAHGRAYVICDFLFENTSSDEIEGKLGFPGKINDGPYAPYAAYSLELRNFQVIVDGEERSVETRKEILRKEVTERGRVETFRYWYTWDVVFPPLKTIKVSNSYEITLSSDQQYDTFEYIMTTGANWKGNIEKAEIEIIYENAQELKSRFISAQPKSYTVAGNKIKWKFVNFIPKENILLVERSFFQREQSEK